MRYLPFSAVQEVLEAAGSPSTRNLNEAYIAAGVTGGRDPSRRFRDWEKAGRVTLEAFDALCVALDRPDLFSIVTADSVEVEAPLCGNGHPQSEGNVYVSPSGKRACRDCRRESDRRRRA